MKDILSVVVPIGQFSWDTKRKVLTAFASDLPKNWLDRVWGDSCDVGVKVRGKRETKIFTLEREEHAGGELAAWHLKEYLGRRDGEPWVVIVFND
jgi:hypothetical protein